MDGIRGHQRLQKSRGDGYLAEVKVGESLRYDDLSLEIAGRVDGYYPDSESFIVEEIKTIRVEVSVIPESIQRLYWGQVKKSPTPLHCRHQR